MNKDAILRKIREETRADARNREDPRFLNTMGFLVGKGFLKASYEIPELPNKILQIEDALWAGRNVEPRILEVLPAAVLRLDRHFDLDPIDHPELFRIVSKLRRHETSGEAFFGIPYEKIRIWTDLPLRDGRVKAASQKRTIRTFRFRPETNNRLRQIAAKKRCTETEVLEKLVANTFFG